MTNLVHFLERIVFGFWNIVYRCIGLIVPFLYHARDFRGWSTGLRRVVHILVLTGILIGLYFLNQWLGLGQLLKAPRMLRPFWLPIIFLLLYALVWLGWWLWKLLVAEEEAAEFPDIDQAWNEALAALVQAGVDLRDAPLFLVLGKPAGTEEALFQAAQLQLLVHGAPQRPDAPLHVFANREGVFVTCAGASLLGRQADILAAAGDAERNGSQGAPGMSYAAGDGEFDQFKTVLPTGELKEIQDLARRAAQLGGFDKLTDQERQRLRVLGGEGKAEHPKRWAKPRAHLLKNTTEANRLSARLRYLCRLITQDRKPFCPLNGVLVLVPFAGTDSNEDSAQTGNICQQDLATVRKALQLNCPVFAMLCDLELAEGWSEFIARFPSDQKTRRLGQRFPLVPDLSDKDTPLGMVERGSLWICNSLLPTWVYKLFRVESPGKDEVTANDEVAAVVRGNARLYHFLNEVRERRQRFSQILTRGLAVDRGDPVWFGGCYLASTGRDAAREQAFVAGVFRRLPEEQDYVAWTAEALKQEEKYNRWTNYGYIGLAVCALLGVAVWLLT